MILDEKLELCDAVSAAGTAATVVLGDQVDLVTIGRELLDSLYLVITVGVAFTGGTSAAFELVSDSVATLDSSPTIHGSTGAIAVASLPVGARIVIPLPLGPYERYLGVRVTRVGTISTGTINAFLTNDPQTWKAYADAVN